MVRRVCSIATLLLLLLPVDRAAPAAACRRSCAESIAACRKTECVGLGGPERQRCVQACRERSTCAAPGAPIRTLAYVVTDCRYQAGLATWRQKVVVRRGDWDPVTVRECCCLNITEW